MIATVVLVLRLALAIALYVFLGWSLLTLWQELRIQGRTISNQKKAGISVKQMPENGEEREFHFFQTEILIGRHTRSDLTVMDENVSAQHARLTHHHGRWWLEDLNSTNGTFLNGSKLNTPTVVITEDEFRCGNTRFTLRVDAEE